MTRRSLGRRPAALVLGGSYRALAVVRSLGRHGVPVTLAATDGHSLATRSRYVEEVLPWQGLGGEALVSALLADDGERGRILVPTDDDDAEALGRAHARLSDHFAVTVSPWERLEAAADKRRTYALAGELGIPFPRGWPTGDDPPALPTEAFPVIVKPAYRPRPIATTTPKAWPAADAGALLRGWAKATAVADARTLIVQEAIPGGGETQLAYGALCRDGDVLASIVARRTRQRPMDFGLSSTFVESVADPEVEALAERWIAAAGLSGLVEVEFKRPPGGAPRLLDVNARAWGWISLGAHAGVDFPWLLWRMARGEDFPRARARTGARWMRTLLDAPTAAAELLAGRLAPRAYLASWRPPLDLATFARDDPAPALHEPIALARLKAARARNRARA
jgi:predicted ATP-grasp superfamily ATP-dependent carboligase